MKSLPKTMESLAKIAEKEFGNIEDQPLKDLSVMSLNLMFSFNIGDLKVIVSGFTDGSIMIEKYYGKGKKPKKKVQSFDKINDEDFLDLVNIPIIELQEVSRGELFFTMGEHKFLLSEQNTGYKNKGLSVFLYVLEDGFKRTELKEIGWLMTDGDNGYMRSSSIVNEHTITMEDAKSLALSYIFKFLKVNS
jgi:hypothetical protein